MDALTPVRVEPTDARLKPLFEAHLELVSQWSPPESVHAMDASELTEHGAHFFAVFEDGIAIGMGAIKTLSAEHGELKSMHVLAEKRGGGIADALVLRLLEEARDLGVSRVSLETGSQESFAPARALYGRHGFTSCGPFEGYGPDPHSYFMTREV